MRDGLKSRAVQGQGHTGEHSKAAQEGAEGLRIRHHDSAQQAQDKSGLDLPPLVAHHQIYNLLQIAGVYLTPSTQSLSDAEVAGYVCMALMAFDDWSPVCGTPAAT